MPDYLDYNPQDYDPNDTDSGFFGDPFYDDYEPDAADEVLTDVLDQLGIDDFDEIIVNLPDANLDDVRGNVFPDIISAIIYLYDAGIIAFSKVVIDDDEGVEIEISGES